MRRATRRHDADERAAGKARVRAAQGAAMKPVVLVGLVDMRGWGLLQERDERAPIEPDKWCLVGGGVEEGESPETAADRELKEETGIVCDDLVPLGQHTLPCEFHGQDVVDLFAARSSVTDAAVVCGEGRQIVFVDPSSAWRLDLTETTRTLLPLVLDAVASSRDRLWRGRS
jgi:8-oxo-dGTP pyrophosphatase MutT (NUDIX family)